MITKDLKKLIEAESKGNLKDYMDSIKEKNKFPAAKAKTAVEKVEERKKKCKSKKEKIKNKIESGDVFGVATNKKDGKVGKKKSKKDVVNNSLVEGDEVNGEEELLIKKDKKKKGKKENSLNGEGGELGDENEGKKKGKKRKQEGDVANEDEVVVKKGKKNKGKKGNGADSLNEEDGEVEENKVENVAKIKKTKQKKKKNKPKEKTFTNVQHSEFSNVSSLTNKIIKFHDDGTAEEQTAPGPDLPPKLQNGKTIYEILNSDLQQKKVKSQNLPLRQKMMQRLKAARFRYINEQIYTTESKEAAALFKEDPTAFLVYHEGYKQQVRKWPMNPLDNIIETIKKLPKSYVIADFGCGEGKLAKSVEQQVHSFDLVAADETITACDMKSVPLKNNSVDVVVFCLSLMGTNLDEYLLEANRVLKTNGILKIAEVESRFDAIESFLEGVRCFGFKNTWKDLSHNLFYFMDFKKERDIKKKKKLPTIGLHPCLYKRR